MSRRSHLTDVASIACNEVDQLGAGEKEGWLSDASVLTALHHRRLAVASAARPLVVLLEWDADSTSSSLYPPIKIRPSLASDEGSITAVEWVDSRQLIALAVGTSAGYLMLYSLGADLIHKQMVHPGHILRLRFRESNSDSTSDMPSMELCVVMPGVIARFDGSDIQSLLQRWFQEADTRGWGYKLQKGVVHDNSYSTIPFQLWNVGKYGSCADAAIVGLMPPPLLELQQLLLLLGSRVSVTIVQLQLGRML